MKLFKVSQEQAEILLQYHYYIDFFSHCRKTRSVLQKETLALSVVVKICHGILKLLSFGRSYSDSDQNIFSVLQMLSSDRCISIMLCLEMIEAILELKQWFHLSWPLFLGLLRVQQLSGADQPFSQMFKTILKLISASKPCVYWAEEAGTAS